MYTTCCVSDFAPFVKVDNVPNFYFIFYLSLKLQKMCFIIRLKRPFTIFQFQEDIWSHNSKNSFQIGPGQRWHELSAFGHNLFLKLNVAFQMYYNLRTFDCMTFISWKINDLLCQRGVHHVSIVLDYADTLSAYVQAQCSLVMDCTDHVFHSTCTGLHWPCVP